MGQSRSQLIVDSIVTRADQLKQALPNPEQSRGSSIVPLLRYICDDIADRASEFGAELDEAPDEDADSYFRSLQRLLQVENALHEYTVKYAREIDRNDLPVGLLYLVDSIVLGLLGDSFDPLIHSDVKRNYSTDSLRHDLQPLVQKGESYSHPKNPVVFNVPSVDPANAFLTPILVHEATHTYLRMSQLVSDMRQQMPSTVQRIAEDYTTATQRPWPRKVSEQWLIELLCDCVATLTTGPSFPLALAGLAASIEGAQFSETHPFMADRLALIWDHLRTLGWEPLVRDQVPEMAAWLDEMKQDLVADDHSLETALRRQVYETGPALMDVCKAHVGRPLEAASYSENCPEIRALIEAHTPPVELRDGQPISPWSIVLSGWIVALRSRGSVALPAIISDAGMSEFLIKAIELSAIVELWRTEPS